MAVLGLAAAILFTGPTASQAAPAAIPDYYIQIEGDMNDCTLGYLCVWSGDHYSSRLLAMRGEGLARCEGYRFEGTIWQDNVRSIWNRAQGGPSSIWNRRADGSFHYAKYASLGTGYRHDTAFSQIMDAWVWDPAGTCQNLRLWHVIGA
ncbi:peptidase inhibitor family I36 protein [Actinoplanes sp. NPDC051861]|uniref:peptidase inhibitor family I36 protein n=1 Tax=Actinoplanes sp. NPDC051861 TaxID=3155170 RepID=UPI00344651DC